MKLESPPTAESLAEAEAYLSGVSPVVGEQIRRTHRLDLDGPVKIVEATAIRGESTRRALAEGQAWLVGGPAAGRPYHG